MADTLEIFGTEFQGVEGIKATDDNSTELTYTRGGGTPTLQTKSKTYTPTTSQQTESVTADGGYDGLSQVNITVNAMPIGSATPASSISATGASVSTGTNTLTLSKSSVSNTPQVSAGYVSSGTAGNTSVSLTASVTTKSAATYHPSSSNQTISASQYLTGAQTINAVTTTNLSASNIKNGVTVQVGDSSDSDCVTSVTGTYAAQVVYTGSSAPSSGTGNNGDIYIQI